VIGFLHRGSRYWYKQVYKNTTFLKFLLLLLFIFLVSSSSSIFLKLFISIYILSYQNYLLILYINNNSNKNDSNSSSTTNYTTEQPESIIRLYCYIKQYLAIHRYNQNYYNYRDYFCSSNKLVILTSYDYRVYLTILRYS
jgi:hypothetical protein